MKRVRLLGTSFLALAVLVLAWSGMAEAQDKTARGTISVVAGDSVTVKVGASDMKFNVDSKTEVLAIGAGTKSRTAAATGQPGPKLADLVKAGQAVVVTYREMGAMMQASRLQVVSTAGSGGGSVSTDKPAPTSNTQIGTVKSVTASSLTVTVSGKDMAFAVDASTSVVGRGAGTKTQAAGGKIPITDLVKVGDRVSVTYDGAGATMHLASVRVM